MALACLDAADAKAGLREVYMMTHGGRLLLIFRTGFPSWASRIASMTCDRKQKAHLRVIVIVVMYILWAVSVHFKPVCHSRHPHMGNHLSQAWRRPAAR